MVGRYHVVRLVLFPTAMLKLTSWRSAGGAESVRNNLIRFQTWTYSQSADCYLDDLVYARHDRPPREANKMPRGA